jgi:hypothetical protein
MYTNLKSHLIARELEVRSAETTSRRIGGASLVRSVEPRPRRVWRWLHRRFPTSGGREAEALLPFTLAARGPVLRRSGRLDEPPCHHGDTR